MGKQGKKKQTGSNWLGILFFMLIGAGCGLLMMLCLSHLKDTGIPNGRVLLYAVLLMLGMYAVIMVQLIIHEAGHLVFGLLSGYRFNSFRIFNLMWLKENGRVRLKRLSIAGTGGQCLMAPPDLKDGKLPVLLYNFGGAIVNMVTGIICLTLALMCPVHSIGQTLLLFMTIVGISFALMNGLPLAVGPVNNDGRNAIEMTRDPEAMKAFWIQMKANELTSEGVRLKDMPAEWFILPSHEGMKNGITSTVGVLACNRLMDEHRFEEADRQMACTLASGNAVNGLYRALLTCDRMYVELITSDRAEVLERMRTKNQLKIMKAMKNYPSVLRTEYVYALLQEKDPGKAENIRKQFDRYAGSYPYACEIEAERELMSIADERADADSDDN